MQDIQHSLAPIVSENLGQMAYDSVERAILSGQIAPGTKLSEVELARQLGISRGPLREAIGRLEGQGLVTRVANQGPRVTALSKKDLIDLLVFREAVEGIAAYHAALNATDDQIAAIGALLDKHAEDPEVIKDQGYFQGGADADFHLLIAEASGNSRLSGFLNGPVYSILKIYRGRLGARPGRPKTALAEHRAIVEAIRARDPDEAEKRMRDHIRRSREHVSETMPED